MKSWTLFSIAGLLALGVPTAVLAEAATEEMIDTSAIEVVVDPETAEAASGDETEPMMAEVADAPVFDAADAVVVSEGEVIEAESAMAEVLLPSQPVAPVPLDPAREVPANGSFVFGPLGVDSEGRTGRIHLVATGDTLWDISDAYLGTPWVWPSVWNENGGIENPHLIVPGDRIWISSTEMRRVTEMEAEALMAAANVPEEDSTEVAEAIEEEAVIEDVPAALDESPASEPMAVAVTGPPPEKEMVTIDWKESMGFLSKRRLDAATSIVGSPSVRNWLSQGDSVYLGLGGNQVKVGDQFMIFDEVSRVYSLESERVLGYHINHLGWVEVTDVSAESSVAEVKEAWHEIERGARAVPRGEDSVSFEVEPASKGIQGHVIFTPNDRTQMGTIDHVYLDIGSEDGLKVGSKLDVIVPAHRKYDDVQHAKVTIPDHSFGQVVIIATQPNSAVALVTHTRREVEVGQVVRGAGN